jgi:hypothetical protein
MANGCSRDGMQHMKLYYIRKNQLDATKCILSRLVGFSYIIFTMHGHTNIKYEALFNLTNLTEKMS